MFQGKVETSPIPERVYEVCRVVAEHASQLSDVREKLEPSAMAGNTSYFGSILTAAKELQLVEQTEDDKLTYIGDKKVLRTMVSFRKYCNSVVFNDRNTMFYQTAACFITSNLEWLKYPSLTSEEVMDYLRGHTNISPVYPDILRGTRFWMSFLGFGFVSERPNMVFLPNMYLALKDFMEMAGFETKEEYTMSSFVQKLMPYCHVALEECSPSSPLNYCLSAALRTMHDNKEIQLQRYLDSQEVWQLYRQESHAVVSEVTHITILKEVQ